MTGSVALFSDALESIVNVLTAIAALIRHPGRLAPARPPLTRSATTRRNISPPCSKAR